MKQNAMKTLEQMATVGVEAQCQPGTDTIPDFVRASDNTADPVGRYKGEWGFWCECWMDWNGGFADEASTRQGLATYVNEVLHAPRELQGS